MFNFIKSNLPIKVSEKYKIRLIEAKDKENLFEVYSNEKVAKYISRSIHKDIKDTEMFMDTISNRNRNGDNLYLGICEDKTDKIIGVVRFFIKDDEKAITIGYGLNEEYWGKGIIPQSIDAVINVIKYNYKGIRLRATIRTDNYKSIKCIEKLGFQFHSKFIKTDNGVEDILQRERLLYFKKL
ncbi:GNAT family N-acetyltransferase [Clostridium sp. YIM B02505]|uniref:GNAT family N-acetyltransferase n=1 Tax=Clostridium yunnanense TaxID=2800325 RepID=A0ABS1EMM2_9CLOT|nr:GNAT family N-acetyltransferase [Clostridium yunnanense]MBK1810580.1 GNAT family N-acetyltransferase [Clostridium yunnanense]